MKRLTTEIFIQRAKYVHGDTYDYSKTQYINLRTRIKIICPKHGEFLQFPQVHLKGQDCKLCGQDKRKRLIYGKGINDLNEASHSKAAYIWHGMLQRCYDNKSNPNLKTYIGCSVCEEWHYLSNFKKWFDENYIEGYDLDKDILVKGNQIYSPDTCCFIPHRINSLLINCAKSRGKYPIGVCKSISRSRSKFYAHCQLGNGQKLIGSFSTPEESFYAYKQVKEKYIKDIALQYFNDDKITERVYNALMNWEISITD